MPNRGQLELIKHAPDPTSAPAPALSLTSERTEMALLQARLLADARGPKVRMGYARAFCATVLATYWQKLKPRCKTSLRQPPEGLADTEIRSEGLAAAKELAEVAARLPIDDASYLVGRTYAAMLPEDYRSTNGVFYTPPAIVERLLDSVTASGMDWSKCRALDPACGGGAFLGPVARRMAKSLKNADKRVALKGLAGRLKGFEIDPFSAWLSAVFLDATLNEELGFAIGDAFEPIDVCDSLTKSDESADFDLVIGNPPYGRVGLTETQREAFKRSLYGHANLYGVFLDLALRKAKAGGIIAYVTPTGFLAGNYFKNLRALLGEQSAPISLHFISQREGVFDDVLQETLLAVFHKGKIGGSPDVSFIEVKGAELTVAGVEAIPLPKPFEQPWIFPRSSADADFVQKLRAMSSRLADWGYSVSTGPLVWNRHKKQLVHEKQAGAIPLIWAESVSADGEFEFRHERRNHAPYFVPKKKEDDWLLVELPSVLVQRTTAKEQTRRLIAAELPKSFLDKHGGAVTVENHLNMVLAQVAAPPVSTRALAAFLNSSVADRVFRCISGTVAVSAYELESMPLPPPWALKELDEILSRTHTKAEVDEYCRRLYGDK